MDSIGCNMADSSTSFSEIRALAAELPPVDSAIWEAAGAWATTGAGSSFANTAWIAKVQRRRAPQANHLRAAVFAAAHGIAADSPEGSPAAVMHEVEAMIAGGEVPRLAEDADCELKLYELAVQRPTRDSRLGPAMEEGDAAMAAAYGMMAIEPGLDAIALADLGSGPRFAAVSLGSALVGGIGVADPRIVAALARHRDVSDPLDLLAALGGPDIAAMLGTILAARLAGVPVILDGAAAQAAAAIAWRLRPDAIAHCRLAAPPAEPSDFARKLPLGSQLSHSLPTPQAGIAALAALRAACAASLA